MNKHFGKILAWLLFVYVVSLYFKQPEPEPFPYNETNMGQIRPGVMNNR